MLDLNTSKMVRGKLSDEINDLIDEALQADNAKQAPRDYLGASLIGEACKRKIVYNMREAPREPFSGRTLRIFERGHRGEEVAIEWLRQAGYTLKTEGQNGRQIGFRVADGRFAGHCDGVLLDGPILEGYPRLWENKVLGGKGWRALDKHGLVKQYPQYADQVAVYQTYLELTEHPALFTAVNADTMELLHLEVPFDPARAQAASDKAVDILRAVDAGDTFPRVSDDPDYYLCRFCDFSEHCWGEAR